MFYSTYAIINVPLVMINFLAGLFFIYCLVCAATSGQLKQPLKILLETLVFCIVTSLLSMLGKSFTEIMGLHFVYHVVFFLLSLSLSNMSMTSSVWLNIFYYTQIVPVKRALAVWIKKNVKFIIFSAWIFERMWALMDMTLIILRVYPFLANSTGHFVLNTDFTHVMNVSLILVHILRLYLFLTVFVMVMSSVSISVYLWRHIRRMSASGLAFSSPKFYSQLRVTITGILQSWLYMLCGLWNTYMMTCENVPLHSVESKLHFTVINLYMFGTSLNLWMGQSVFRQRTADLFQALKSRILTKPGATGSHPAPSTVTTFTEDGV